MARLEVEGLEKHFGGIQALDGVSFVLEPGEFLGLIGPNGSGKSTLINCITGYYSVDGGAVRLGTVAVHNRPPEFAVRAGIARTFQVTKVFRRMTVHENLLVALMAAEGRGWRKARERMEAVLEAMRLAHLRHELAGRLSGGQQRLLEFGMVALAHPAVVLLDEPFSGVHPELRLQMEEILEAWHREGKGILLVSHDMPTVFRLCRRVLVFDKGRKIADGPPERVRSMPEVLQAYLGG